MIEIRLATDQDAKLLTRLNRTIQEPHAAMAPNFFKGEVDEKAVTDFFRETISEKDKEAGIAAIDGEPVGYVLVERIERPETPFTWGGKRLMIHHLVVLETARCNGVGTALMHWAEDCAREAGIGRVVLDHMVQNDQARLFYARQGYQALRVTCSKDL